MVDNTPVNSQVTDAVTQANIINVCQAPAVAVGALSQSLSMSLSLMFANAVKAQQQANVIAEAATAGGVARILGNETGLGSGGAT